MRTVTILALVMLIIGNWITSAVASTNDVATVQERGKLIGAKISTHPEWFKESFLEIAEDAAAAGQEDKHVILFMDSVGCPYCNKMIEENFKHSSYTNFIRNNFDTIPINIRGDREIVFSEKLQLTEKQLARHLDIRFTPTMLFLDSNNKAVLRVDGYRSVEDFKFLLDYVQQKAYQKISLAEYLVEQKERPAVYTLRDHPNFESLTNLSSIRNKPLMVIFEDDTCGPCDALHDNILSQPSIREFMDKMTVVRLDARSRQSIISAAGQETTPMRWAKDLELNYRPGIVLFDEGQEVFRIDALRWMFHFQQAMRYVTERQWRDFESYRDYALADRDSVLESGQNVDVRELAHP
jgi:thioredoxin-related protein